MFRLLALFSCLFCTAYCLAQQPSQYSLYMFNRFSYNPAYAGLDHSLSLTGIYRRQWQGIANSPITQNINLHAPLYLLSGGIGINVENDKLGFEQNLLTTLAYNFQLPLGDEKRLSMGVGAGFFQKTLDGNSVRTPDGNYQNGSIEHNDGLSLPTTSVTLRTPTFNFGVYFQTSNFEAGISAINLQEPELKGDFLSTQLRRNYFVTSSYKFDLSKKLTLQPSFLLKTDQTEWQTEASLLIHYNNNVFLGGALRGYNPNTLDAASLILGLRMGEKLTLAYAYDYTLSQLSVLSNGSHEVMINYNLNKTIGKGKLPKIIYNPRY